MAHPRWEINELRIQHTWPYPQNVMGTLIKHTRTVPNGKICTENGFQDVCRSHLLPIA